MTSFTVAMFISLKVDPPGVVENVTLRMDLNHPNIWLKVNWQKPTDMGSLGVISHYIMRWGKVSLPVFALEQPQYTHEPLNTTLANASSLNVVCLCYQN